MNLWILVPICFLAAFSRSTFGFGDALIAMPLLSLAFELDQIRPVVALLSFFVAAGILLRDKKGMQWRSAMILIPAAMVGVPIGVVAVDWLPTRAVKAVLAIIIIGFCTLQLSKPKLMSLKDDRWAPLFGFGAGLLGGAYNTQGPLMVIYSTLRQWTPEQFRATMQGFFLPTSLTIIVGHWLTGKLTQESVSTFAVVLPFVLLSVPVGSLALKHLDGKRFRFALNLLLIAAGVALLVQAIV